MKELYEAGLKGPEKRLAVNLEIRPESATFTEGDYIELLLDLETPPEPIIADIFWVLMKERRNQLFFAPEWETFPPVRPE